MFIKFLLVLLLGFVLFPVEGSLELHQDDLSILFSVSPDTSTTFVCHNNSQLISQRYNVSFLRTSGAVEEKFKFLTSGLGRFMGRRGGGTHFQVDLSHFQSVFLSPSSIVSHNLNCTFNEQSSILECLNKRRVLNSFNVSYVVQLSCSEYCQGSFNDSLHDLVSVFKLRERGKLVLKTKQRDFLECKCTPPSPPSCLCDAAKQFSSLVNSNQLLSLVNTNPYSLSNQESCTIMWNDSVLVGSFLNSALVHQWVVSAAPFNQSQVNGLFLSLPFLGDKYSINCCNNNNNGSLGTLTLITNEYLTFPWGCFYNLIDSISANLSVTLGDVETGEDYNCAMNFCILSEECPYQSLFSQCTQDCVGECPNAPDYCLGMCNGSIHYAQMLSGSYNYLNNGSSTHLQTSMRITSGKIVCNEEGQVVICNNITLGNATSLFCSCKSFDGDNCIPHSNCIPNTPCNGNGCCLDYGGLQGPSCCTGSEYCNNHTTPIFPISTIAGEEWKLESGEAACQPNAYTNCERCSHLSHCIRHNFSVCCINNTPLEGPLPYLCANSQVNCSRLNTFGYSNVTVSYLGAPVVSSSSYPTLLVNYTNQYVKLASNASILFPQTVMYSTSSGNVKRENFQTSLNCTSGCCSDDDCNPGCSCITCEGSAPVVFSICVVSGCNVCDFCNTTNCAKNPLIQSNLLIK